MRARRIQLLFERFRDFGDGAALAAVFDACAPRLFELACHLVREPAQAEDLVQATFLVAIAAPRRYDGSAPLEAWLYGILWREALKSRRQAARRLDPRELHERTTSDPAEALAASELPLAVRAALDRLPTHEREVLEPFLLEDLRPELIAQRVGRSAGTVRSQIHRALEKLRRQLPASLAPTAAVVPIRGLAAVRGEVLAAAGVPAGTAAAVVAGGAGSRALISLVACLLVTGGWLVAKLAFAPSRQVQSLAQASLATGSADLEVRSTPVDPSPSSARESIAQSNQASIDLVVVDYPNNRPVTGIEVQAWPGAVRRGELVPSEHDRNERPHAAGVTDSQGRIELVVPSEQPIRIELPTHGNLCIWSATDHAFRGALCGIPPLEPGAHREVRMQALWGVQYKFFGRVLSREDGRPIPDAWVAVLTCGPRESAESMFDPSHGYPSSGLRTDSEGRFELDTTYLEQWSLEFAVIAAGFAPTLAGRPGLHQSAEDPFEIRVPKCGTLEGRVLGAGSDARDVQIKLSTRANLLLTPEDSPWKEAVDFDCPIEWRAHCEMDGSFAFAQLPTETDLTVEFTRGGGVVQVQEGTPLDPVNLASGETRRSEWRLAPGARVTGIALDASGQPVIRHEIWVLDQVIEDAFHSGPSHMLTDDDREHVVASAHTDDRGRFVLAQVAEGSWWIGLAPDNLSVPPDHSQSWQPLAQRVEVRLNRSNPDIVLRPSPVPPIRGKVLGPTGAPIGNVSILVFRGESGGRERARTGADGAFEIVPADAGSWKLKAWAPDLGFADSPPIEAQTGQTDVVLQLATGTELLGQIASSGGAEHAQVCVEIFAAGNSPGGSILCRIGEPFDFSPLLAGKHDVLAVCEPDRIALVRDVETKVDVQPQRVNIELSIAAVLRVRYGGAGKGRGFEVYLGDSRAHRLGSVDAGHECRMLVPAGTVRLKPLDGGNERTAFVRAGTETEIVLDDD